MDEASAVDKLVSELNRWYKSGDIKTEVETKVGFVDILTLDELIEVKNINQWKNALGQLLAYGRYYPDKRLRMHLFSGGSIKRLEKIIEVCQDFEITITHDTGLYLIPDNIKNIVRARKHRQRMTPIPCDIETKRKAINKLPSLDVGY